MGAYASGKFAFGFCDICGFRYKLKELKETSVRDQETSIKACPECWNQDHPQNSLGSFPINDPQALRGPRPTGGSSGRGIFGFNPVGDGNFGETGTVSLQVTVSVGTVEVTVS